MLRKTFLKINKAMLWIFCLLFLVSVVLSIVLPILYPKETTGIITAAVGIIISLPATIISFLSLYSLPKDYNAYSQCCNFTDRNDIIRRIILDINNGKRVIKITGAPNSGVSELLVRFAEFKKNKSLLESYCKCKKIAKSFRKKIGKFFYINGRDYRGNSQTLKEELINIINLRGLHYNIILLDHIYEVENPNSILEFIELHGGLRVIVICDIGTFTDKDAYEISAFSNTEIKELADTYGISLSDNETKTLYDLSWGNVGLLTVLLRNFDTNLFSEMHGESYSTVNERVSEIINKILDNTGTRKLSVLCATLNYCQVAFDLATICEITGYNIGISTLNDLVKTGLFIKKNNTYFSNNYFSFLIRNDINYEMVSKCVDLILNYSEKTKNAQSKSIMLLCKNSLSLNEIDYISKTLTNFSVAKSGIYANFVTKVYNAYSENRMLALNKSPEFQRLEQEIVFQYISALIFIGNYSAADKSLCISDKTSDRLLFLKADLLQLQNNYDEAEGLLTKLSQCSKSTNIRQQSRLKLTHCYKHVGRFDDALDILNKIIKSNESYRIVTKAKVYTLNIYILKYDYNGLYSMIHELEAIEDKLKDYQKATLDRYRAVAFAKNGDHRAALKNIANAIDICKKTDSRLILNCYYIRGEINRHFGAYAAAYRDFIICYNASQGNSDYNLRSMAIISIKLINNMTKNTISIADTELSDVLQICATKKMQYNVDILSKIMQCNSTGNEFPKDLTEPIYIIP